MDQHRYLETSENAMLPLVELSDTLVFMQDGDPCHRANSVKAWLEENHMPLLPWCARSPDLNPIENIWAFIDRKLCKTRITNLEQLKDVLHAEWLAIPREMCMTLVESIPKRVFMFWKAKGGYFKA